MRPLVLLLAVLLCEPAFAGITINELMPDPAGTDANQEWVELYNSDSTPVDVGGWSVEIVTSSSRKGVWTIPSGVRVPAKGFLLIGGSAVAGADVAVPAGHFELGNASSSGDMVRLVDGAARFIDTVIYGPNNSDGFTQDDGVVATSLVAMPGSGKSIGRNPDGTDTQVSGSDFRALPSPSPKASNGGSAPACDAAAVADGLVINEFVPDPDGTDTGNEWVELYNGTSRTLDIAGWKVVGGTSSFGDLAIVPAGTKLSAGQYLLLGGTMVAARDLELTGSLGNASSNADAVRLVDCIGAPVDTVVYGAPNSDMFVDDGGVTATSLAPKPVSGASLARKTNGGDTDRSADDFQVQTTLTPKGANPTPLVCEQGDLVINELLPDPDGTDTGQEWVEVYNRGGAAVSLAGWSLDATGTSFSGGVTLPDVDVPAGGYALLGQSGVTAADAVLTFTLGNASSNADGVRLVDCKGVVVDTVVYGSPNSDNLPDDGGGPATSLAPKGASAQSLARIEDGYDTNLSADDFAAEPQPTPKAQNREKEPVVCVAAGASSVVVNEILVDPPSTDTGFEWIELYNPTAQEVKLDGWGIAAVTDAGDVADIDAVLPGGTSIPAGGFLVVGGDRVPEVDVVLAFTLGNGSGGDAVVLWDCEGKRVDGVLYGEDASDGIPDDLGAAAGPYVPASTSGASVARLDDGEDTNGAADWFEDPTPSPGATNFQEGGGVDPGDERGCGRNDEPGEPGGGCFGPDPATGLGLLFFGFGLLRRGRGDKRGQVR
jgi:hypothetical protein